MPRRDDDDIEIMGGLSVERDDAFGRQPAAKDRTSERTNAQAGVIRSSSSASSTSTWVLGGLLVIVLALTGWLGLEMIYMQKQFEESRKELEWARNRVDALGRKVQVTGTTVTAAEGTIESKFKFFDSEIRKLWGVSNDRNKKAIQANEAKIEALANEYSKKVNDAEAGVKSLTSTLATMEKNLKQIQADNKKIRQTLQDQDEQMLLVRGELELVLKRLNDVPVDLARRVKGNEEAIEAIDAARRQFASSITQLTNRINQLQLSNPGSSTGN